MFNAITTRIYTLLLVATALTLSSCWYTTPPVPPVPPSEVVNYFEDLPPLVTERLVMKPLEEGDEALVKHLFSDEETVRYLVPVDADDLTDVTAGIIDIFFFRMRTGRGGPWLVYKRGEEHPIGVVGFQYFSERHVYCQFIVLIAKHEWGKGYATEASHATLDFAFRRMRVNRVESTVDERNPSSIRLHKKLGFTHEGTFRKKQFRDGGFIDVLQYGLLRSEYLAKF